MDIFWIFTVAPDPQLGCAIPLSVHVVVARAAPGCNPVAGTIVPGEVPDHGVGATAVVAGDRLDEVVPPARPRVVEPAVCRKARRPRCRARTRHNER